MRHQNLIVQSHTKIPDGLGGYIEELTDIKLKGKVAFKKDKMVVTRANEVNTQKLVSMVMMYLDTNRNKEEVLMSLKKGDRFIYQGLPYSIHLIEAYQKIYVITFMEDFDLIEDLPIEPIEPDEPETDDTETDMPDIDIPDTDDTETDGEDNGEFEDYWG